MSEIHFIQKKIHSIRSHKIMLDSDLATLYGVETKQLTRQMRRHIERFPSDFVFQLTSEEFLRCQIGTSSGSDHAKHGGRRFLPYAFTANGIAMLSSVLGSPQAIQANIEIMRTFTRRQEVLFHHQDLKAKVDDLQKKYDGQFQVVFDAIKRLIETPQRKKSQIGFHSK